MNNPIAIISNDQHLSTNNIDLFVDLCHQEIELCLDKGIQNVIWLGDLFDSRIAQRQEVLNTLANVLELYSSNHITITCIPGNHDKTVYEKEESFLTPFKNFENFDLIENVSQRYFGGEYTLVFIPFFSEQIWLDQFSQVMPGASKILCSHIAVTGSRNNDGTVVMNNVTPSLFNDFHKVLLGHYHNEQKIGSNIYHLHSTHQAQYGEDEKKGFTILYEDGSLESIIANFPRFKKIKIEVGDNMSIDKIDALISEETSHYENIRVELVGEQSQLCAFSPILKQNGIDCQCKYIEAEIKDSTTRSTVFTESDIKKEFEIFCKDKSYDYQEGIKYLKICQ